MSSFTVSPFESLIRINGRNIKIEKSFDENMEYVLNYLDNINSIKPNELTKKFYIKSYMLNKDGKALRIRNEPYTGIYEFSIARDRNHQGFIVQTDSSRFSRLLILYFEFQLDADKKALEFQDLTYNSLVYYMEGMQEEDDGQHNFITRYVQKHNPLDVYASTDKSNKSYLFMHHNYCINIRIEKFIRISDYDNSKSYCNVGFYFNYIPYTNNISSYYIRIFPDSYDNILWENIFNFNEYLFKTNFWKPKKGDKYDLFDVFDKEEGLKSKITANKELHTSAQMRQIIDEYASAYLKKKAKSSSPKSRVSSPAGARTPKSRASSPAGAKSSSPKPRASSLTGGKSSYRDSQSKNKILT